MVTRTYERNRKRMLVFLYGLGAFQIAQTTAAVIYLLHH